MNIYLWFLMYEVHKLLDPKWDTTNTPFLQGVRGLANVTELIAYKTTS